jgi:hypothetical protein
VSTACATFRISRHRIRVSNCRCAKNGHRLSSLRNHIMDRPVHVFILPEILGAAVPGPALDGWLRSVEQPRSIRFEIVHRSFRDRVRSDHNVNMIDPDMCRDQCPATMGADSLDRLQDDPPAASIKNVRSLVHTAAAQTGFQADCGCGRPIPVQLRAGENRNN